ncbi:YdcF family protein [Candidatus Roizmanbacteria bacterium]|nr:YdcF family protein [Candidatus Roizmanbacteria bacterium]
MNVEKIVHKGRLGYVTKSILGIVGLAIAAELIVYPLLNINHTSRVLSAFDGRIEECAGGEKAQNDKYPYGAIFVLGGSAIKTGKETYVLSDATKLRLDATAKAYKDGWSGRIFIIYGEMGSGEEHIAVDYLQSEYYRLTEGKYVIPDGNIIVENKSRTTNENIIAIAKIIAEHGIKSPILITDKIHMPRAKLEACEKFSTSSAIAEDIINGYPSSNTEQVHKILRSKTLTNRERRERILILLKIWDDGRMVNALRELDNYPPWR